MRRAPGGPALASLARHLCGSVFTWGAMKQEIEAKIAELNASHDEDGDDHIQIR
jgi:hypothetical protein